MTEKILDIEGFQGYIQPEDLANIFNVYPTVEDSNTLIYNLNSTLNILNMREIPLTYIETYAVKENDNWQSISYKQYNTTRLWWFVCKSNGVTNSLIKPKVGWVLKLLSRDYVYNILNQMK